MNEDVGKIGLGAMVLGIVYGVPYGLGSVAAWQRGVHYSMNDKINAGFTCLAVLAVPFVVLAILWGVGNFFSRDNR